ncbi:MAG: SDR family NAD(P)-dependent oxidoreductase [Baekduia sp.]
MRDLIDSAMEAVPPLAYTSIGYRLRNRLNGWGELPPAALAGKVCVVTGATRGLGFATASALIDLGAKVEIVGRDRERTEHAAARLAEFTARSAPGVRIADVGDLARMAELAAELRADHERVDVLIHNAGAIPPDRTLTPDGLETIWATMVAGPHALTRALGDRLAGGRVIWVTSGGMYTQRLRLDDPQMAHQKYDGVVQYARAKRAQVDLVAEYAERALPAPDTASVAVHPGWAATPGVEESLPGFNRIMGPVLRSAEQGADTAVWLAATGEPLVNGALYFDRRVRSVRRLPKTVTSAADRRRLWDLVESERPAATSAR